MVTWMIGLSRAGKTTLSKLLYDKLKPEVSNLVLLDGDAIRILFGNDVDHTIEGRRRNAERISHLCKFLSDQNIHVIAAVLSIFPEWQSWNRENIENYQEVYIKASLKSLEKRDTNDLYAQAKKGTMKNVVGFDIPFPEPKHPDLVIENNIETTNFDGMLERVLLLDEIKKIRK
ncbi:adenylyl-sulfate kinase [Pseudomonadales bacterium]|nr:adenylyl-sulfate kinase [Pseudomonadales bacterium]